MCLQIDSTDRPTGLEKVYKVYSTLREGEYLSCYRAVHADLTVGNVIESDRASTQLTEEETARNEIERGLHGYTQLSSATWEIYNTFDPVIVEMEGQPEDFVARGTFSGYFSTVYTKLKVIRLLDTSEIKAAQKRSDEEYFAMLRSQVPTFDWTASQPGDYTEGTSIVDTIKNLKP